MFQNGQKIKITHLPTCKNAKQGTPNPYIGMEGIVHDFCGKTFSIFTGSSWLVGIELKKCKFIYL
jgi:hypothetical protein